MPRPRHTPSFEDGVRACQKEYVNHGPQYAFNFAQATSEFTDDFLLGYRSVLGLPFAY